MTLIIFCFNFQNTLFCTFCILTAICHGELPFSFVYLDCFDLLELFSRWRKFANIILLKIFSTPFVWYSHHMPRILRLGHFMVFQSFLMSPSQMFGNVSLNLLSSIIILPFFQPSYSVFHMIHSSGEDFYWGVMFIVLFLNYMYLSVCHYQWS